MREVVLRTPAQKQKLIARIEKLRAKGWSVKDAAEKVGTAWTNYYKWTQDQKEKPAKKTKTTNLVRRGRGSSRNLPALIPQVLPASTMHRNATGHQFQDIDLGNNQQKKPLAVVFGDAEDVKEALALMAAIGRGR